MSMDKDIRQFEMVDLIYHSTFICVSKSTSEDWFDQQVHLAFLYQI